jgi:hypothetical protein
MLGKWLAGALLAVGACTAPQPALTVDAGAGAPPELAASLNARVGPDSASFTLHVSNSSATPVRLGFGTAQRYDFEVGTLTGEQLWKWSADRMFAQALDAVVLKPGESIEYTEVWPDARAGRYWVQGRLTSTDHPVELRTEFEVPSQ